MMTNVVTMGPSPNMALGPQLDQEAARRAAMAPVREVPPALVEALRTEMKQLVEGDITKNVGQLINVATKAAELFQTIRGESIELQRRRGNGLVVGGADSMYASGPMMAGYGGPEQFGARAIRELVSLVPEILAAQKKSETSSDLVTAIALAKAQGQDDIVAYLREKLLGPSEPKKESETAPLAPTKAAIVAETNGVHGTNGHAHAHDCDAQEGGA